MDKRDDPGTSPPIQYYTIDKIKSLTELVSSLKWEDISSSFPRSKRDGIPRWWTLYNYELVESPSFEKTHPSFKKHPHDETTFFWQVFRETRTREEEHTSKVVDVGIAFRISDGHPDIVRDKKTSEMTKRWNVEVLTDLCYFGPEIPEVLKKYAYTAFFNVFNGRYYGHHYDPDKTVVLATSYSAHGTQPSLEAHFLKNLFGLEHDKPTRFVKLSSMIAKTKALAKTLEFKCPITSTRIVKSWLDANMEFRGKFRHWNRNLRLFVENGDEYAGPEPQISKVKKHVGVYSEDYPFTRISWGEYKKYALCPEKHRDFWSNERYIEMADGDGSIIHTITDMIPTASHGTVMVPDLDRSRKTARGPGFVVVFRELRCLGKILERGAGLTDFFYHTIIVALDWITRTEDNERLLGSGLKFRYLACAKEIGDPFSGVGIFKDSLIFHEERAQEINEAITPSDISSKTLANDGVIVLFPRITLGLRADEFHTTIEKLNATFAGRSFTQKQRLPPPQGKESASKTKRLRTNCQVCGSLVGEMFSCGRCGDTSYCGKECQERHWASHSKTCNSIN